MILFWLCAAARAADTDLTLLAGGRTAPESAIQVPSVWQGHIEPSALGAFDGRVRVGSEAGAWVRASAGAWGYLAEADADEMVGGLAVGWARQAFDLSGRYDVQWFPVLEEAGSGRAELLARGRTAGEGWSLEGRATAVDRRYTRLADAGFTTAEVGAVLGVESLGPVRAEVGASGQANQAGGIGADAPWGGQARTVVGLALARGAWHLAAEYRFLLALEGETETETRPVFTPLGEYSDDVDALSGGGFLQHRVGLSGAVEAGDWTFAASGMLRLRDADAEELAVAYGRTFQGQLRVERGLGGELAVFAAAGTSSASLTGGGYTDVWGWGGLDWRRRPAAR